jgi:hypothetical protein
MRSARCTLVGAEACEAGQGSRVHLERAVLIFAVALPALGQYAGPAILSRGEAPAAMATPQIDFRPFINLSGIYSTGLSGIAVVDTAGNLANAAAFGERISWGLSGVHSWRHTHLGLDYVGNYDNYNTKTNYSALNQNLALGLTQQLSPHVQLSLRESAGIFSRTNPVAGLSQTVPFDSSSSYVPTTDFYDNRTIFTTTQADLIFQKSARLSFSMGGDFFSTERRSKALYGVIGGTARGDTQYRLSQQATIGVRYTYNYYHYTRIISSANLQGVAGTYAIRLSRFTEFTGYAGAMRVETKFLQSVPIDPNVAALLGIQSSSLVISYRVYYVPDFALRLSRTFHTGVAYINGGESMTPGNGLFLTSRHLSGTAGYGYTGLRRWSLGLAATYIKAYSEANYVGNYGGVSGTFNVSRSIGRNFHVVSTVLANQYRSSTFTRYNRLIYTATLGIGWTPGDVPLRVW